ncbi:src homology 2 domain-containing protein sprint isoform X2 [Oratosquilla oratoria]|uniref:src homology 2 domain-containing protein sprint isoform X2 n=1 Tax=Oratosquilla oratoria TaxID=337810 RepID=UPI003F76F672
MCLRAAVLSTWRYACSREDRRNGLTNEYLASVGEASTVPRTRSKTRLQQCAARPRRFLSSSNLLLESSRPSSSGGGPASAATPAGDTAAAADAPPGNEVGDHLVRPSPAGDRFHSNGDHDDHDLVRQRPAPSAGRAAASSDDDHDDLGDDLVRVGRPSCSSRRPPPDYNSTSSSSSSASPRRGGGSGRGRRQRRRPRESGTCARGVRRPSAASGRQPPGTMMTMTSQAPPVTLQSPGEASKYGPFSPPGGGGLPLTSSPFLLQQQACNGGGSAGSSQTGTSSEDDLHPCHISIEERLQRSSSIWLLKDLQRTGAVHLLKDQEEGTFIVRGSSKTSTWAISVRLPQDKGPHIEHYLIETHPTAAAAGVASASSSPSNTTNNNNNTACLSSSSSNNNNHNNNNNTNCSSSSSGSGSSSGTPAIQFSLEASENRFNELTSLIAYYSQRCDELPVQLRLPRVVREAKSRHDLASLAYLGQEFWGSYMASPSSSASPTTPADPPTCLSPASAALTPTAAERPNNLNFSSFGKGALSRDNSATNLSQFLSSPAATGIGGATKFSGSTASLVSCSSGVSRLTASSPMGEETKYHPARPAPAPPLPHTATTPVDRSSLVLNLDGSLEKSGFSSFRSQPTTPITPLRPTPPPRTSPPNTQQKQQHKPPPPTRTSRPPSFSSDPTAGTPVTILSPTVATASTELLSPSCEVIRSGPTPPPRWARSNITVTTTLTLNVNQVAALPVQINDSGTPQSSGVQLQIAQLEIPVENRTSSVGSSRSSGSAGSGGGGSSGGGGGGGGCPASGPREGLQLHITQHIAPKSGGVLATHSTPCTPLTPSSDGADLPPAMTRSRLRAGPRDKRRHSNHYHEANIIDSPVSYHRSSLADKISDYEDVWSSPPRDLHTPSHESARTPTADRSHMTSFKPRCEFSKSLGDLTEISLGSKANVFSFDPDQQQQFAEESIYDNHHFNGVDDPNNRMSSSPFYAEPADALREAQQQQQNPKAAGIKKASSKLCRKVANRLSDSNIEWHKRTSRALMDKIESSEEVSNLASSSAENLVSSKRLESEKNEANVNGSSRGGGNGGDAGARRHSRAGRGKPVAPPRVGGPERDSLRDSMVTAGPSPPLPWKLDSSWRYHGGPDDSDSDIEGFYDAHREGRFPLDGGGLSGGVPSGGGSSSGGGENESITTPGRRTVQDLITERLPNLSMPDAQSLAPSCATRVSEYDNVGEMMLELVAREERRLDASPIREARGGKRDVAGVPGVTKKETQASKTQQSHYYPSTVSDSGTEFSEPWDSKPWMSLLRQAGSESVGVGVGVGGGVGGGDRPSTNGRSITPGPPTAVLGEGVHLPEDSEVDEAGTPFPHTDTESLVQGLADSEVVSDDDDDDQDVDEDASVTNLVANMPQPCAAAAVGASSHLDSHLRHRIMSPQRLARQHRQDAESGGAIRKYAIDLGSDQSTTFSQAVSNFITCTKESPERDPHRVVQNIRQFMSGMKNYLVTSGEKEFEATVKKERSNLKSTEFLNLDAILEDVLVRLALCPLWEHINNLFVEAYTANKSIQSLATNMKYARSQHYTRLGIKAELTPPHGEGLDKMKSLLTKMQQVYAPRQKLEYLLETVSLIYQSMYQNGSQCSVDADDLVPMIMWVLCHCHFVSAEVEAEYMWGLLLTSFSSGEASYYLTAFSSAINAVKNLTPSPESSPGNSLDSVKDVSMVPDHGVMKIVIPDEKNGSIVTRTLPIRPGTTTREVCKMMAHKMRVTNPQDYGLYKLVDGRESLLGDLECPHKVKWDLTSHGFHCTFAFKRTDAKIAWPFLTD